LSESTNLIYLNSKSHLIKVKDIISFLDLNEYLIICSDPDLLRNFREDKRFYYSGFLSLLLKIFFLKRLNVNRLICSQVDLTDFQLLYFFINYEELNTFDEGYFSLKKNSRYNSEISFSAKTHLRYKILNKIFSWPKTPLNILMKTEKHFTWYPVELHSDSCIEEDKLTRIERKVANLKYKLFIGQPWELMGLNNQQISDLLSKLKEIEIDIYIMHPREDHKKRLKQLDSSIQDLKLNIALDHLFNILKPKQDISLYTVSSTAVIDLETDLKTFLLKLPDELNEINKDQKKIYSFLLQMGRDVKFLDKELEI